MMPIFVFLSCFVFGFVIVTVINSDLNVAEKIGTSLPIGFGLLVFEMIIFSLVGLNYSIGVLLILSFLISGLLYFSFLREIKLTEIIGQPVEIKKGWKNINLTWIFTFCIIGYLFYGASTKALFWPTAAYDSVTGYDYMAKVSAAEGTFNNTIFAVDNPTSSIRHSYPPFVAGSYSIAYMAGLESSKIVSVLLFGSLLLFFWAIIARYSNHTIAILLTLLFMSVPEFLANASLSLTNIAQSFFAAAGLIIIYLFTQNDKRAYLNLGIVLLGLNVMSRADGVVFIAGGGVMLLLYYYQKHKLEVKHYWKPIMTYSVLSIFPFVLWQIFLKLYISTVYNNADAFKHYLFWDSEKLNILMNSIWQIVSNTQVYGWFFILFAGVVVLNALWVLKRNFLLLVGMLASMGLYVFLFYQMDNGGDSFSYSISSMVSSSFKRGMFPFLPMMAFYIGTTELCKRLFKLLYTPIPGLQ